jgi:hypothetical protein
MASDKEFVSAMADYTDAVLEAVEDIVSRVALWEMDIQRRIRRGEADDALVELRDYAYTCHMITLMMRDHADKLHQMFVSMTDLQK